MKKILSVLSAATLGSTAVVSTVACYNPLTNGKDDGETNPPEPPIKDIEYYQRLIEEEKEYVAECQEWINDIKEEWKNDKEGNMSDEEYQLELDQVQAELYFYQSEINEYQYQILLLKKQDDKFNPEQVLEGITIVSSKIINLEQELKLKEKYPNDYLESELQAIRNSIKAAIDIKEILIKMKEEESKCDI